MAIELSRYVGVRFRPDDHRQLLQAAESLGVTFSQLLRDAVLAVPVPPQRPGLVDDCIIDELGQLGNKLNQQTRLMHQLSYRGLTPDTEPLVALLEQARDLLTEVSRQITEAPRRPVRSQKRKPDE